MIERPAAAKQAPHALPERPGRLRRAAPMLRTPGSAHAAQQVDEVPVGPYDVKLDAVARERGILALWGLNANPLSG